MCLLKWAVPSLGSWDREICEDRRKKTSLNVCSSKKLQLLLVMELESSLMPWYNFAQFCLPFIFLQRLNKYTVKWLTFRNTTLERGLYVNTDCLVLWVLTLKIQRDVGSTHPWVRQGPWFPGKCSYWSATEPKIWEDIPPFCFQDLKWSMRIHYTCWVTCLRNRIYCLLLSDNNDT